MYNVLQLLLPGVLYWPMEVWYIVVRWYRTRCYYIGYYEIGVALNLESMFVTTLVMWV